ncbi:MULTISPECIES: hypothetical protein [Brevibacillus]|uniref:hypothetical protein n=1 Tax=Brevibacillus TaxID=55080 RepID=UPI000D0ED8A5|nr:MULTISPECIES: hypothetical protein [Brevibacillus]MED1948153.1 hypothetical protein [Brevibacillus formosus]MED1998116.1 hypothetical protein [Brevibacillus formosus]MED2080657.1 hypothetical protein [Brevibacillus formosus]PSK20663.1 hypothetical protein C7R94_04545 [Brevibacillus sp. NRRL NRS-603]
MEPTKKRRWRWMSLTMLVVVGVSAFWWFWAADRVESMETTTGAQLKFRASGELFEVYQNQKWQPFFAKGVNLGASLPGHYPGELPITREDYMRWFAMIDEMGANVIRVYTIHSPVFYEALVDYNRRKEGDPLYLMQGIWSPEELLIEKKDAYLPEIREEFRQEIKDAVGAVYGDITLPEKSGKASGTYRANAGKYLIGWHTGTEWDPVMVRNTNRLHQKVAPYQGKYFHATPNATAFETWLAEMVDTVAVEESKYGWQHPMTFTNWVTTDPLSHPGEPIHHEDLVSVDPTHIEPTQWDAGYFASYHVYPYYPDFFRYDTTLQQLKNDAGQIDTYKAYLRQLKQYHKNMPIMVTEFGVPASVGVAHLGNLGRNQGGHSEKQQGEIDVDLLQEIHQEGYAGAIVFVWQDEWFKKTWNTMRFELPEDRRSLWVNVLTNESLFGVLGMYPNKEGVLTIDGNRTDWDQLVPEEKQRLDVQVPGVEEIWMTHDEGYVYFLAQLKEEFDPAKQQLYVGVDTLPGGNKHAAQLPGLTLDEGLETLITLGKADESQIQIAANYDFHARLYGKRYGMLAVKEEEKKDNSGIFKPWKLAVSLEMEPPDSKKYYPLEEVEVGKLIRGTTDAEDPQYDSRTAWQAKGKVVELRVPWMLLGFTDPSSLSVMSYEDDGKSFTTKTTKGIRILPLLVDTATKQIVGQNAYAVTKLPMYTWQGWEQVGYHERKKQSYSILKKAFHEIEAPVKIGTQP